MIELHINGADLMVSGQFDAWQSRLMMGPDLDQLGVQLAIDSTSVGTAGATGSAEAAPGDRLFRFESHDVTTVAAGVYRVTGQFQGAGSDKAREMELQLETSTEHTPTFVISFSTNKAELGAGWTQLIVDSAGWRPANDVDGPARQAQAWLTLPELAAA